MSESAHSITGRIEPAPEPKQPEYVQQLRDLRDIQAGETNDPYMRGLYNGLELALSCIEAREPVYIFGTTPTGVVTAVSTAKPALAGLLRFADPDKSVLKG